MLLANGSPFFPLLGTVINSILEVFLICVAGYVAARKNIIDKNVQRALNKLNVFIFTPALLFSKVAFFLTPAKLKELWVIPLSFVIVSLVSAIVANIVGRVFRLKPSQRNFATAASMFMNSNSLPIALMQSLVITVPALRWDENDEPDAMLGRALTYLVLFSTLGMVLRWSYGVRLLAKSDEPESRGAAHHDVERAPVAKPQSQSQSQPQPDINIVVHGPDTDYGTLNKKQDQTAAADYAGREGAYDGRSDSDGEESDTTVATGHERNVVSIAHKRPQFSHASTSSSSALVPSPSASERIFAPIKRSWRSFIGFMTPPLWAALLSLVVACVQPVQHFLDQHFTPLKGALSAAGSCSVPVTMVVLGAYFHNSGRKEDDKSSSEPDGASAAGQSAATTERTPLLRSGAKGAAGRRVHKERSTGTLASVQSTKSVVSLFQGVFRAKRAPRRGALYLEDDEDEETGRGAMHTPEGSTPADSDAEEAPETDARGTPAPVTLHDYEATAVEPDSEPDQERLSVKWKQPEDIHSDNGTDDDDAVARRGEGRTVLVAVLARMVLVPLALVPLFALAVQWDAHELFDDPIFIVSTILLIASPPAITLAQITQAASSDAFERLVSRTIFWSYCVVTPPSTVVVVIIGLFIAGLA